MNKPDPASALVERLLLSERNYEAWDGQSYSDADMVQVQARAGQFTDVVGYDPAKKAFKTLRGYIMPSQIKDSELPKLQHFITSHP